MGLVLDMWIEFLIRVLVRNYRELGTKKWPTVEATVVVAEVSQSFTWLATARITYTYVYAGKQFEGVDANPFLSGDSASSYMKKHKIGSTLTVRVSTSDPSKSIFREPYWLSVPVPAE